MNSFAADFAADYEAELNDSGVSCIVLRAVETPTSMGDSTTRYVAIPGSPITGILYQDTRRARRDEKEPGTVTQQRMIFSIKRADVLLVNDIVLLPSGCGTTSEMRGLVIEVQDNQLGWDVHIEVGSSQLPAIVYTG